MNMFVYLFFISAIWFLVWAHVRIDAYTEAAQIKRIKKCQHREWMLAYLDNRREDAGALIN